MHLGEALLFFAMSQLFVFLIAIHGIIHFLGFVKAFELADVPMLAKPISRFRGALWLLTAFLFLGAAWSYLVVGKFWWVIGAIAVVLSQVQLQLHQSPG